MDEVTDVVGKHKGESVEVPVAVRVPYVHNLKGEVTRVEGSMNEITKWTMSGPVIVLEKSGHTISNEPSSALVAYVLSFYKTAPNRGFAFCNGSSWWVFFTKRFSPNISGVIAHDPNSFVRKALLLQ